MVEIPTRAQTRNLVSLLFLLSTAGWRQRFRERGYFQKTAIAPKTPNSTRSIGKFCYSSDQGIEQRPLKDNSVALYFADPLFDSRREHRLSVLWFFAVHSTPLHKFRESIRIIRDLFFRNPSCFIVIHESSYFPTEYSLDADSVLK
jgi:hypothetical protein